MKNVVSLKPVTFNTSTVLQLSAEQASKRSSNLRKMEDGDDLYEVTGQVMFKVGEQFGIESEQVTKSMAQIIEAIEDEPDDQDLIDLTAPEIKKKLPTLSDDELQALKESEEGGKKRVGLLNAIAKEQQTRTKECAADVSNDDEASDGDLDDAAPDADITTDSE